ncbi:MAG: non-canonical purine NTP diphosphatase [Bacteroidota bacterium]
MEFVFATHNRDKLREVQAMLPERMTLLSLDDIGCFEAIPETGHTLEENASLKIQHIAKKYGYQGFADDTGLLVNALNGAPGVYSARYAGDQKNTVANIEKLLFNLETKTDRSAQFETVIALSFQGNTHLFRGSIKGTISKEKRGKNGFGYDPIFIPEGYDKTFAELPAKVKNTISHRALAIEKLIHFLSALALS